MCLHGKKTKKMETIERNNIIETAVLIRTVEEKLLTLFSEGKLYGTVHTCIGQELSAAVAGEYLTEKDYVFSNHRCHGHFIAITDQVEALIAEIMGKSTGVCGGWGGSQHLCYKRFFSNGIQGGFVPITAGLALSEKLKNSNNIAACFIGEGTLGEGAVYESANLMSKWELPALIIIENNRFSQSTPQEKTVSGEFLDRFKALDINCFDTNTWDLDALYTNFGDAVDYVRNQRKPAVIRIQTDRLMAHSKGDDDRPKDLLESYWARDVLTKYQKEQPKNYEDACYSAQKRVDKAVENALAAEIPTQPVFNITKSHISWQRYKSNETRRINEIMRDCFDNAMKSNETIVMLGEDICDPYGGAFKVTKGLSTAYPDRILGTTISEYSIVGLGNGLSLAGMMPVCEIMFGDFMTFTLDQILNHAAKFPFMYNHQVKNPMIIRTPMGGGRGYGPTHSQSLEKFFVGIPQTTVISLNQRVNPADIYITLFEKLDHPALVFENKLLYAKRLKTDTPDGYIVEISDEQYPTIRISPEGETDLTILCYGGMLGVAEEAQLKLFDEYEINAEIICPSQIYPYDESTAIESVRKSHRLLIIEEGYAFAAWGSEVITKIMEREPGIIEKVQRINMAECPIPCCGPLEKQMLPNVDKVLETARRAF